MTLTHSALAALPLAAYADATRALVKACDALTTTAPPKPKGITETTAERKAWSRIVSAAMKADTALQEVTDAIDAARLALPEEG